MVQNLPVLDVVQPQPIRPHLLSANTLHKINISMSLPQNKHKNITVQNIIKPL